MSGVGRTAMPSGGVGALPSDASYAENSRIAQLRELPWWYLAAAALIFILAFSIPVLAGLHIGGVLSWFSSSSSSEGDRLFPEAFSVNGQGAHLRVPHQQLQNPAIDGDFLLTTWVNLKRLPQAGERVVLLSKFEGAPKPRNGYALGLSRDEKVLRPIVFWGDVDNPGRWYDFPEIPVTSHSWFMLALSFTDQKFLGLYLGTKSPQGEDLQLLGGYELGAEVRPSSQAALVLGAPLERGFRGQLGPLGIFHAALAGQAKKVLKGVLQHPSELPEALSGRSAALWIPSASLVHSGEAVFPDGTAFVGSANSAARVDE